MVTSVKFENDSKFHGFNWQFCKRQKEDRLKNGALITPIPVLMAYFVWWQEYISYASSFYESNLDEIVFG